MNYRGFGLAWLVVWLLVTPAGATPLTVGALGLNAAEVWQRGSAEEETDFDSVILRMGNGQAMLEVFLPRHRARPKTSEAKFIEQLELSWRRRYGQEVALDWLEIGGKRWRVCRRPSQSGDGNVFQIVALHKGEVYQVVAVTPPEADRLPLAVQALLEGGVWDGVAPMAALGRMPAAASAVQIQPVVPVAQAKAAAPAEQAVPMAQAAPAVPAPGTKTAQAVRPDAPMQAAAPEPKPAPALVPAPAQPAAAVAAAPAPAPEARPTAKAPAPVVDDWRLLRRVVVLPGNKDWPELAEAEGHLLGTDGPVTGLGLETEKDGLDGFLEGYLWRKGEDGRERRQTFRRHWLVRWTALTEHLTAGQALAVDLDFLAEASGVDSPGDLAVSLELVPACAPRKDVIRWLDGLAAAGVGGLAELGKMACKTPAGAPAPVLVSVTAKDFQAAAGARVSRHALLPVAAEWLGGIQAETGEVRRLILVARFRTAEAGASPGAPMFRLAAAVFVFGP